MCVGVFCCFLVVAILGALVGAQSAPKIHPRAHKYLARIFYEARLFGKTGAMAVLLYFRHSIIFT